MKSTLA